MKQRSIKRTLGPIAALGVASLILAACGGSDGGDATTSAPAPTDTNTSAAPSPTDAPADGVAEAKARYDAAKAPITFTYPGEAFEAGATAAGKNVAIISLDDRIPVLAQWGDTWELGLNEYGVNTTRSSADFDIEAIPSLFSQAVSGGADLILTNAIPPALIPFNETGDIPVMTTNQTGKPGVAAGEGVITDVTFDYTIPARLMADWYIVNSNGGAEGEALVIGSEGQPSSPIMLEEIAAEIAELCPDCTVDYTDAQLSTWQDGVLASETRNALTANPNLKFLLPIYDGMTIAGTDPGVTDAGSDAIQSSFNATPVVMQGIGSTSVTMDVGCPNDWFSFATVDAVFRIFAGAPLQDNYDITCRVFDTENIGEIDPSTENSPNWYGIDFLTEFKSYWGAPS